MLSLDEKSQMQALDRTQPGLPMKKCRLGTMTHDYKRHGTTTLFAALDVLAGKVIPGSSPRIRCMRRRRHQEFIRFLDTIEAEVPAGKIVEVILDNYAVHKHPKVHAWRGRGVFRSIVDLQAAINRFLAETNDAPKPFRWTADPDHIIAAVKRGHQVLESIY